MRRYAVVTALTAALALAALADGARAPVPASAAEAGASTARDSQTAASPSTATNGGGGQSNVEKYRAPARRGRGAVYALMCATLLALALVAFAVVRKMRSRLR